MNIIKIAIFIYLVFLLMSLDRIINTKSSKKEGRYEEKIVGKKSIGKILLHQGVNLNLGKGFYCDLKILFKEDL